MYSTRIYIGPSFSSTKISLFARNSKFYKFITLLCTDLTNVVIAVNGTASGKFEIIAILNSDLFTIHLP